MVKPSLGEEPALPEGEPALFRIPSLDSKDRALLPAMPRAGGVPPWEFCILLGGSRASGTWHPGQEEAGKCEGDPTVEGQQDVASAEGCVVIPPNAPARHRTQTGCQLLRAIAVNFAESGSPWKVSLCHILAAASL